MKEIVAEVHHHISFIHSILHFISLYLPYLIFSIIFYSSIFSILRSRMDLLIDLASHYFSFRVVIEHKEQEQEKSSSSIIYMFGKTSQPPLPLSLPLPLPFSLFFLLNSLFLFIFFFLFDSL